MKISVITVCYNCADLIETTISSIISQDYSDFEYIVIDGGSTDGTVDVVNKYISNISRFVSESDCGIYDAMNKAIDLASGEWLIFINAGDALHDKNVLSKLSKCIHVAGDISVFYSDVLLIKNTQGRVDKTLYKCNHNRLILNHQAMIYKKSLHDKFGKYLVYPRVTISDYLFFSLIPVDLFKKVDFIISNYLDGGVSNAYFSIDQKFLIDYLFSRIGKIRFILSLLFYKYKILFFGRSIK